MAPTPTNHHIIDGSPLDPKLLDGVGVCEIAAVRVGEYDTATDSVDVVEKDKDGDAVADSDRIGVKDGDGVEPTKHTGTPVMQVSPSTAILQHDQVS